MTPVVPLGSLHGPVLLGIHLGRHSPSELYSYVYTELYLGPRRENRKDVYNSPDLRSVNGPEILAVLSDRKPKSKLKKSFMDAYIEKV